MTNYKQQTAVEWLEERLNISFGDEIKPLIGFFVQAKEMQKEQSQAYAAFCVACDRKKLPLLEFEGWIKLEGGEQ